ncbi:GFA family protein [Novosphingobium sp. 9U]|uniref:GFA family protein n=1 Tax=Novosphingobium sp. 9U TaxID=2653158 RepID=UPI0012F20EEF|nr:GFA family protein [Novosphingobium sp. 9U]VWX51270.1 GFA family protein [Novosphingobium sp. 9U]
MEGGCSCGAVRYRLASAPFDTGWCHCRVCQKISGAPALVFTTVPVEDFVVEQGVEAIRTTRPTEFGQRQFCGTCGTPLTIAVDFQPETIDVTVASLDDPDALEPGFHIFTASAISWEKDSPRLPRHEGWRPDTRGKEN